MTATLPRHYPNSRALCDAVHAATGGTAIVSFSGGKDAIASVLQLRECGFTDFRMYYLYIVPGLEFIERGLRYYEDAFKVEIVRLPHQSLSRMLRNLVYQPPERAALVEQIAWPKFDYADIYAHVRKRWNMPEGWIALGTRTADSPFRLANVKRYGSLNPNRGTFLPIFDWRLEDVRSAIVRHGLKLPAEYRLFGRSFDGLDYRFLAPIKQYFPRDYERILSYFPLAHLDIFRRGFDGKTEVTGKHRA